MPGRRSGRENRSAQDWRSSGCGDDHRRGGREGRGRSGPEMGGRGGGWRHTNNLNLHVFVSRDREPRHQHDMRAFVMSARLYSTTGKLSEAISWLGDTSQFGVSRVMDICRASSTTLDVDAGPFPGRVSFQRVFLPLIDLATSTEFKNSPLRSETNVLFSTLYKLDQADGLWPRVFDELSKLTTRGSVRDTSYTAFHRDRDKQISGVWEPSTWVDVVRPIVRFMIEVTKRFRDAVLLDTAFQKAATETLPNLIAAWKTGGGRGGDPPPSRTQLLEVDDAMANLDRVMGATLQILRASEAARAERENEKHSRNTRSELFNLSDSQRQTEGATYDGPGVFSRLQVKRHDNDAERISEISVAPTADEILCERPPYVPRNAPSTWDRMNHLKSLAPDSPARLLDTHFRLLRQDFVEPLREAMLGYRREQLKAQNNGDDGGVGGGRRGVFKAGTEGGRSFLNLFVFKNVRVVGISGTTYGGVKVSLEFDKPDAVMSMSQNKQRDHWERSGRLAVANMVVICEAHVSAAGDTANEGNFSPPLLVFAVISERDLSKLSGPGPRAEIGVSFDSSAGTVAALESLLDLGGRTSDGRLLMLQPSNSYFAYRPILQVLKSPAREVLPFADTLLPPSAASAVGATARDATEPKPPRYLLQVDAYDLTDLISPREGNAEAPLDALRSVSMLDRERFPMTELLDHTTLDQAQLEALRAALSREVALIQGPPGTGKTFVGAKVVRLLLTNRRMLSHWRGPIMCVCLTNHALDQFLCDLLDAGVDGIVRVGGSCKTDRLKRFMLRELSQGRRDSCGKEMYRLRNLMKQLSDDMRDEWEWAGGVTAITANFRDANWSTTEVLHRLLVSHAPPVFEEAIVNGNKHPVVHEDGWQTVGKMPSGIKDWLAGKNPADVRRRRKGCRRKNKPPGVRAKEVSGAMTNHDDNGRTRRKASLPDAQDGTVAGTNERKRRDQERALDRRAAATLPYPDARRGAGAASSVSVPSEPLPSADGTRAGESKQTTEDLDDDDRVAAGNETADAKSRAIKQGEDHIATGIARSVAAGNPWLALADVNHDSSGESSDYSSMPGGEPAFDSFDVEAEPKNTTLPWGGVNDDGTSSWSFANSGLAPMADGEEWEMFESEETDDDEEGHVDGGHLEAKGNSPSSETHPDVVHPPAALPRTPATSGAQQQRQNQKRQHVEQSRGFGAGRGRSGRGRGRGHGTTVHVRFAAGPDDVGGPGFGAGRGKRDDAEMKAGERSVGNSERGGSSLDEDDEGHWGSTSDGLEQGSGDEGEEETDSVASSTSEDPQSESDDDEDSEDGSSEEGDPGDARPTPPAGAVDGLNDYDIIVSAVLNGRSVWALSPEERRTLCRHWQQTETEASRERLARMIEDFFSLWERHDNHKTQGELAVLQEANVVGMTTTGVAMHQSLVEALGATVVVVEEAAEVMEAHILAVLTQSTQHLILIGDHLQLRPKAEVYRLTKESRKGFDLDVSMFERLVKDRRVPVHDLATQRRMRPEIADLIRPAVYPNLKDARQVQKYPAVKGMRRNLFFWDHAVPEDKSGTVASSKTNRHEAKLVSGLVQYLLKQGYTDRGDITVLTPYLGQLFVLRDVVGNSSVLHVKVNERDSAKMDEMTEGDSNGKDGQPNSREFDDTSDVDGGTNASPFVEVAHKRVGSMVRMATVDNFQGEESKIIIMSLVRSNRNADIGFLRSSNRVNVALSRAQHGMYIIGNAGMLESKRGTMWSESVIPTLREKGAIGTTLELQCARHKDSITVIHKYEEFGSLAGDGGCSRACSSRLPCGHACLRRCHPDDPHRLGVRCSEPCPRLLQPCEHPCQRLCGDECGPCYQRVDVAGLPCGHEAKNVSCATSRHPKSIWCGEPVELKVPGCGHEIKGRCTATRDIVRNPAKCTETCGKPLPCGHSCMATCGSCTQLTLSRATTAAETTPLQQQQEAPTATAAGGVWAAAEGDGQATDDDRSFVLAAAVAAAAEQRTHHAKCTTECGRHRSCRHRCRLPCHEGEPCPPCPEPCTLSCEHSSCAQACIDPCTLCAQSCTWHCPHQAGSCRLPCGAPCVRLPCDIRCERKLPCGHRCPSVCGEDCPGSEFCRECGRADTPAMTQVVDMFEFTTLKDHDPSIDPIIVLDCGHAYTLTTLDGLLGLKSAYAKDEKSGRWVAPLPLESDCSTLKLCPDCRAPVSGVSRYNRVTNKAKMDMAEVKHSEWCRKEIALAHTDLVVATADGTKPKLRNNRMRQAEGTLKRVIQASQATPCTRVFEAATATLMRAEASAHELATVFRLQPDHSVRVKAMTGIGRLRTLQLEACRLQLAKAVRSVAFTSTSLIQAMRRMPPTANTESQHAHRAQAINRAKTLEASTSLKYTQGEGTLLAAVQEAVAARAMAAGAAARMALVDLYVQGAQCVIVSKDLCLAEWASFGCDTRPLTNIGRQMVQKGINECRTVASIFLGSVRQLHEEHVETSMKHLLRLDETMKGISQKEVEIVMAVAADPGLSGGVTKYHKCPNGHVYGVGDCGMLNGPGICPECGLAIGGPGYH